jgi:Tol biopolymer transport system component
MTHRSSFAALAIVLVSTASHAQTIRQVTDARAGNSLFPRLDATGSTVVWASSTDPLGTNADRAFQLFRADTTTGAPAQITNVRGGGALTASVSDDGQRMAFTGPGDPVGQNHDRNVEVFVALRDGTGLRQLTQSTSGSSGSAVICGNGSKVVFTSVADLTGGNADHSQEIFVIGWDGTGLRQLTSTPGSCGSPHISDDGTRVVFTSSLDLTGGNADLSSEVFAINADGTGLRQLTSSTGSSVAPWIAGNGSKVVFQSNGNPTGGNADLGDEVFVVNWDGTGLKQLTNSKILLGGDGSSAAPSIDDAGTNVVFHSNQLVGLTNLDANDEIWKIRSDGTGLAALTSSLLALGSFYPAISGDGTRVAFLSLSDLVAGGNADGNPEVYTIKTDKTALKQISSGLWAFNTGSALSADGSRVAYTSSANPTGGNADRNIELFVVGANGSGTAQLTSSSGLLSMAGSPSISGDGARIAFQSSANYTGGNGDGGNEIFAVNGDGTGLRQLTSDGANDSTSPALSSNGAWIAFVSQGNLTGGNADGNTELFVEAWDGTGLIQLTSTAVGDAADPAISSDGSVIAFDSTADLVTGQNADGSRELFAIHRDGTGLAQLTNSTTGASSAPSIRGDGTRIAFASTSELTGGNADKNSEIFAVNADGSGLAQLTSTTAGTNATPVYAADGTSITFASSSPYGGPNPDAIADLWRIAPDGSSLRRLTGMHVAGASAPSVSSDGSRVGFTGLGDITGANPDQTPETFLIDLNRPWSIAVAGAASTTISWEPRAGAFAYDVCRGNLSALAIAGSDVDLGLLTCIDAATPVPNTAGFEDGAVPGPGAGFFYLVRPRDGLTPPSYGQGTGGRERQPGPGDCAP